MCWGDNIHAKMLSQDRQTGFLRSLKILESSAILSQSFRPGKSLKFYSVVQSPGIFFSWLAMFELLIFFKFCIFCIVIVHPVITSNTIQSPVSDFCFFIARV